MPVDTTPLTGLAKMIGDYRKALVSEGIGNYNEGTGLLDALVRELHTQMLPVVTATLKHAQFVTEHPAPTTEVKDGK